MSKWKQDTTSYETIHKVLHINPINSIRAKGNKGVAMHIGNQGLTITFIVISSPRKTFMIISQALGRQDRTKIKISDRISITVNLISLGRGMLVAQDMQTLNKIKTDLSISKREEATLKVHRAAFMMTAILNNQLEKVQDQTMSTSMMSIWSANSVKNISRTASGVTSRHSAIAHRPTKNAEQIAKLNTVSTNQKKIATSTGPSGAILKMILTKAGKLILKASILSKSGMQMTLERICFSGVRQSQD